MKDIKVLGKEGAEEGKSSLKRKGDDERSQLRKREHKSLMKSLTMAQMSTGSMGRFDRKAGKNEPDAPNSQKVLKKKSNKQLAELHNDAAKEKERNMKIFNKLQKKTELAATSGAANKSKSNAYLNEDKLVKKARKKEDKARRRANAD